MVNIPTQALYIINTKCCISSARKGCISSSRKELYLIKPQERICTADTVMRYKGGEPPLMIYRLTADDMPSLRLG